MRQVTLGLLLVALIAGCNLLQPDYEVHIPPGGAPRTTVAEVERLVQATVRRDTGRYVGSSYRITAMEWLPPGEDYEMGGATWADPDVPLWIVTVSGPVRVLGGRSGTAERLFESSTIAVNDATGVVYGFHP